MAGQRTAGATDMRALADDLGAVLLRAIRQSVADESPAGISRGLPHDRTAGISWYAFALEYMEMRWPLIAAKTRDETNDALCAITRARLRDVRRRPSDELLRRAMRGWAFIVPWPEPREMPTDVRLTLRLVAGASRPLADLMDPAVMRSVLTTLRLNQDGAVAAAETQRHKHKVLVNAMRYAVEQRKLPADPLAPIKWNFVRPTMGNP